VAVSERKGKGGAFHGSRLVRPAILGALPGPWSWVNFEVIYRAVREVSDVSPYTVRKHLRKMTPAAVRVIRDHEGAALYQGVGADGSFFPDPPLIPTPASHRPKTFSKRPPMLLTAGGVWESKHGFGKRAKVCKGCGRRIDPPDQVNGLRLVRSFERARWEELMGYFDGKNAKGLARLRRGLDPPSAAAGGHLILLQLHGLDQCRAKYGAGRGVFTDLNGQNWFHFPQYPYYRPRHRASGRMRGRMAARPSSKRS
jgi:hypothetical protein